MSESWIEFIEIHSLWNSRRVKLNLSNPVSILIGPNGTGKTTVMNLVAGTLSVDIRTLRLLEFERIKITLKNQTGNIKPIIELRKKYDESKGRVWFEYIIKSKTSEDVSPIIVSDLQYQRGNPSGSAIYEEGTYSQNRAKKRIRELVSYTWLTVDRGKRNKASSATTIDNTIEELKDRFQKYCSSLDRKELEYKSEFQKHVFASFVSDRDLANVIENYYNIDFEKEKDILEDIYKQFSIGQVDYQAKIESHFSNAKKAMHNIETKTKKHVYNDILKIANLTNTHRIIDYWSKQRTKIEKIYEQRNLFFNKINSLFHYKDLIFDSAYNLMAKTDSGKKLDLRQLSSGEKQIFILFCEALLQEKQPWVYIADEPELSLHIAWQETLIDDLRSVNPNAQIFFATHSPDIVSSYDDFTYDMEDVLDGIH